MLEHEVPLRDLSFPDLDNYLPSLFRAFQAYTSIMLTFGKNSTTAWTVSPASPRIPASGHFHRENTQLVTTSVTVTPHQQQRLTHQKKYRTDHTQFTSVSPINLLDSQTVDILSLESRLQAPFMVHVHVQLFVPQVLHSSDTMSLKEVQSSIDLDWIRPILNCKMNSSCRKLSSS